MFCFECSNSNVIMWVSDEAAEVADCLRPFAAFTEEQGMASLGGSHWPISSSKGSDALFWIP